MPKTKLGLLKQVLYNKASLLGYTPEDVGAWCKKNNFTAFSVEVYRTVNEKLDGGRLT